VAVPGGISSPVGIAGGKVTTGDCVTD